MGVARMHQHTTVAIVDNDRLTRKALRQIVEEDAHCTVLWDRASGIVAQHLVLQPQTRPDILLLDMSLTDTTGVEVCRTIRTQLSDIRILGITAFPISRYAAELSQAGAQGLVTKDADAELIAGLKAVANNQTYCPSMPSVRFRKSSDAFLSLRSPSRTIAADAPLTERERSVLRGYARTGSYKMTAKELGITDSTARNTMARAKAKLGAVSIASAIIIWQRLGQTCP